MTVFPFLLDSKPGYLGEHSPFSLLQLPCGSGTVLTDVGGRLSAATPRPPVVIRNFEADAGYDDLLRDSGIVREPSIRVSEVSARIASHEPSDWILIVEPRYFPANGFDLSLLFDNLAEMPRVARHMIALEASPAGTNERIEFDAGGRVRRVQRYYDAVTWTVARGVMSSLLPVSLLTTTESLPFGSLAELRRALVACTVPTRDVSMSSPVMDLSKERGLLALNHRLLSTEPLSSYRPPTTGRISVHSSARIVGAVVLQPGSAIGPDATIIGPAVIGAGARIERGAVVAQSVVARDTTVLAGTVIRHRVVTTSSPLPPAPVMVSDDLLDDDQVALRQEATARSIYPAVKRVGEALLATITLVMLSPLLLLIALLVKIESKGPVFYGDQREAKDGKLFRCYKFRTMFAGAEVFQRDLRSANQVDGPQFKIQRDPRLTRLGWWLRLTSLDELPQLFNVVMGQMSLVGPRPSPFRENQTCVPWRDARLSVRPGITGLWQVCRHDRESGDFHQWIYYDTQYVRHMSFWVDVKIIGATLLMMLGGKSRVPLSWIISPSSKEYA